MVISTLLIQIYVLIILLVWLIDLRTFKDELFINSSSKLGLSVFVIGIFWPVWIWLVLMKSGGPLVLRLLNKMNNIKF
jgi:hypothetical protein